MFCFRSSLTSLPFPSLFLFRELLGFLRKPSQTVNHGGEEHLHVSLKRPSPSDDAAEDFAVADYFAVAALNKQFFFPFFFVQTRCRRSSVQRGQQPTPL